MRLLDLFSGIGGFSLGLERAGFRTVAFCEVEPYAVAVLKKNWPEVPCYGDIRTLTATRLAADGIGVDAICGGFPCQDISKAGAGAGLAGKRSGLWSEMARLVGEIRPRFVIVENVPTLLSRGLGRVLGDLAEIGYDAEWECLPASAFGAYHLRDRIWIVAYPNADRDGCNDGREVATEDNSDPPQLRRVFERLDRSGLAGHGEQLQPQVFGVADGLPGRVDRLRGLGNAVFPPIPEAIGRVLK